MKKMNLYVFILLSMINFINVQSLDNCEETCEFNCCRSSNGNYTCSMYPCAEENALEEEKRNNLERESEEREISLRREIR